MKTSSFKNIVSDRIGSYYLQFTHIISYKIIFNTVSEVFTDLAGHNFVIFCNTDTARLSFIYSDFGLGRSARIEIQKIRLTDIYKKSAFLFFQLEQAQSEPNMKKEVEEPKSVCRCCQSRLQSAALLKRDYHSQQAENLSLTKGNSVPASSQICCTLLFVIE
jgi:hypothetical protein